MIPTGSLIVVLLLTKLCQFLNSQRSRHEVSPSIIATELYASVYGTQYRLNVIRDDHFPAESSRDMTVKFPEGR